MYVNVGSLGYELSRISDEVTVLVNVLTDLDIRKRDLVGEAYIFENFDFGAVIEDYDVTGLDILAYYTNVVLGIQSDSFKHLVPAFPIKIANLDRCQWCR